MWNPYNNPHYAQYATVTVYYPNSCVNDITTTTTTSSSTSSTTTSSTTSTSSTTTTTTTTTTTFCPNCIEHDVIIGTQTWTGCNLNVDRYRNGDLIPQVTDPTAWAALTTGAWCSYNNDNTNDAIYGKLYNWYAVNDSRGLAPLFYHIPTDAEWTILTDYLGGETGAAGPLKKVGEGLCTWQSPNTGATNTTGFTALPGGYRINNGSFYDIGFLGYWWSSTEFNTPVACSRILFYNNSNVYRGFYSKPGGFSVRCIQTPR
jgi:uncharacterized protein (TIGR02145 family)